MYATGGGAHKFKGVIEESLGCELTACSDLSWTFPGPFLGEPRLRADGVFGAGHCRADFGNLFL